MEQPQSNTDTSADQSIEMLTISIIPVNNLGRAKRRTAKLETELKRLTKHKQMRKKEGSGFCGAVFHSDPSADEGGFSKRHIAGVEAVNMIVIDFDGATHDKNGKPIPASEQVVDVLEFRDQLASEGLCVGIKTSHNHGLNGHPRYHAIFPIDPPVLFSRSPVKETRNKENQRINNIFRKRPTGHSSAR